MEWIRWFWDRLTIPHDFDCSFWKDDFDCSCGYWGACMSTVRLQDVIHRKMMRDKKVHAQKAHT